MSNVETVKIVRNRSIGSRECFTVDQIRNVLSMLKASRATTAAKQIMHLEALLDQAANMNLGFIPAKVFTFDEQETVERFIQEAERLP